MTSTSNTSTFPDTFSLSYDKAIESVLADIPFFCVGLVAFAVFTFFLVMKRVTLSLVFLHTSAFFAFIGAIFDLSQVLSRGRADANNNLDLQSVSGLIAAREIAMALSVGAVHLFLWMFVAQCPRGEAVIPPELRDRSYNPRSDGHSASWHRWGILGVILKWSTLAIVFSIPILQIVWRLLATSVSRPIYVAETTIQVVASAIFILKLILNISISPLSPWWIPVRSYIPVFASLLLGLIIGIQNLLHVAFSETTVGRLLQAVEIYILILYTLIATFYDTAREARISGILRSRIALPSPIVEKLRMDALMPTNPDEFRDRKPDFKTPPLQSHQSDTVQPLHSAATRVVSWISSRGNSSFTSPIKPRRLQDVESGPTVTHGSTPVTAGTSMRVAVPSNILARTADQSSPSIHASSLDPSKETDDLVASYYQATRPPTVRAADSPVYGLSGIIKPTKDPTEDRSDSLSSFDELLRQQSELDKSIAALRLFSPKPGNKELPQTSNNTSAGLQDRGPTHRLAHSSTSSGLKLDSPSVRSDFSLSIFPQPPVAEASSRPAADVAVRPRQIQDILPKAVSGSTLSQGDSVKIESGTQYDVTSFIGDLARGPMAITSSDSGSPNSSMDVLNSEPQPTLKPLVLGSQANGPMALRGRSDSARALAGLPTRPKLQISAPRLFNASHDGQSSYAYEKPRTPPARAGISKGSN